MKLIIEEVESVVSEVEIFEKKLFPSLDQSQSFQKIDESFVKTINFDDLSAEWLRKQENDFSLKVLKVEKCPSVEKTVEKFRLLVFCYVPNLFVFVLEFDEKLKTQIEINCFDEAFYLYRPIVLQISSLEEEDSRKVLVKPYKQFEFQDLSSIEASTCKYTRALKEMLEIYGKFDGDILSAELLGIPEDPKTDKMAESVLCLRVANLFVGGVNRAMSWLNEEWIMNLKHLQTFLAFVDYPLEYVTAVNLAWDSGNFELVQLFLIWDLPFPAEFDVYQIYNKFGIQKILDQRQKLHRSIAEKDTEAVRVILDEIEKDGGRLRNAYNARNVAAMETALKHYNRDIYELLLKRNLKFSVPCYQLMSDSHKAIKNWIHIDNKQLFTKLESKPDDHPLISRCWLAAGHDNHNSYLELIREYFKELEKIPELCYLLEMAKKHRKLKIIFDFKRIFTGLMNPYGGKAYGNCSGVGVIHICALRRKKDVLGTIAHEIAHLVVMMLYRNDFKPFRHDDVAREQEFEAIVQKCKSIYENKEVTTVQTFNYTFVGYKDEKFMIELIVRVPHVIASHSADDIEAAKKKYSELFDFYSNHVTKAIESVLNNDSQKYIGDFVKAERSGRKFAKINKNFVKTVKFNDLTDEWIKSHENDQDLKMLKIDNCPMDSKGIWNLNAIPNLFVLVMQFESDAQLVIDPQLNRVSSSFKDGRSLILQLHFSSENYDLVFTKEHDKEQFNDLSVTNSISIEKLLKGHAIFGGDILTAELSRIPKNPETEKIAGNPLCLRFANLFVGGVDWAMPWLTEAQVLDSKELPAILAFIDYPFDATKAVDLAWQFKNFKFFEILIALDCPFPEDCDIGSMDYIFSEDFKSFLEQRQNLHRSIADKNNETVSRILNEIEKGKIGLFKQGYNINNECLMTTALRNYDRDIIALLISKNFEFCKNCEQLASNLPQENRIAIRDEYRKRFKSLKAEPDSHPQAFRCHFDLNFYNGDSLNAVYVFYVLSELERIPETNHLVRLAKKLGLPWWIFFDFKHSSVGFLDASYSNSPSSFWPCGVINIGARNAKVSSMLSAIAFSLAGYVLKKLYIDKKMSDRLNNVERQQAFAEAVAEWNHEKKTCIVVAESSQLTTELIFWVPERVCSSVYDKNGLEALKKKHAKLFAFYANYVAKDIKEALKDDFVFKVHAPAAIGSSRKLMKHKKT